MNCCQCQAIEEFFSEKAAKQDLSRYHKKGPEKTTRILTEAIQKEGVQGLTLLDIGDGVGAIQHELLHAGVDHVTAVEASKGFIQVAQSEAQRRNLADRVSYHHGNFVDLAESILPADIVTLDKVICCYPEMDRLVGLSAERARKIYGLVYPRDVWWLRVVEVLENFYFKMTRNPFRIFVHPCETVEAVLRRRGFREQFHHQDLLWQVAVYTRET